jgi:arginine deiminase
MANIQISALLPVGYDLFNDATSFLNELANEEVQDVLGGGHHSCHSHHNHKHKSHNYSHNYSHQGYSNNFWGY